VKITSFKADTKSIDTKTGEYRDPLMKWPLRGVAYVNEVGEALRPLIGKYATLSWAPVFLYIGADVYDKYKNDETKYSPDSRRLLKQTIFQGLASMLLPVAAVKLGQNLFSGFGRVAKDGISINTKERVVKVAEDFVANGQMRAFRNSDEECTKTFIEKVHNKLDFDKRKDAVNNPIKKIFLKTEEKLKLNNEKVDKFAEPLIKELIEHRKKMLNPTDEYKLTKTYKDYMQALSQEQTKNVATKSALTKFLQHKMLKGKVIKTIGGFVVAGALIKPIDNFVEHYLIGKVVGPKIDNIKKRS
jgi:hypothetical protein